LQRRWRTFVGVAVVCAALKEEVGLIVAAMGLYAWVQGQRRLGLTVFACSSAWVALCFGVIMPHFAGGSTSLFAHRYGDALRRLSEFPWRLATGEVSLPVPEHTFRYVAHMIGSTGLLGVLAPLELAIAIPALAVNGLSSASWQHGGGAHYSSEAVAPLLVATVGGASRLAHVIRRLSLLSLWKGLSGYVFRHAALVASVPAISLALAASVREGVLPPAARSVWQAPASRAASLQGLVRLIPPEASVSAQSNLFPHLSRRVSIYPFPTTDDAEYILVDVVGTSAPLSPEQLHVQVASLLAGPDFALEAANNGFLLFKRGQLSSLDPDDLGDSAESLSSPDLPNLPTSSDPPPRATEEAEPPFGLTAESATRTRPLPKSFFSFISAADASYQPIRATFGNSIELIGYDLVPLAEVNLAQRRAVPTLYLRALRQIEHTYRLSVYLGNANGHLWALDASNSAQLWHPTDQWRPGELVRVRYTPVSYKPGDTLAFGVEGTGTAVGVRLRVTDATGPSFDGEHVVPVAVLP
jgi:hypothetical protein